MSVIKINYNYDNVDLDDEPGQWRQRRQWLGGSNNLGDLPPWTSWLQSSLLSWWLLWSWSWDNMSVQRQRFTSTATYTGTWRAQGGLNLGEITVSLHYIKVRGHCPVEKVPAESGMGLGWGWMIKTSLKGGPKGIQMANFIIEFSTGQLLIMNAFMMLVMMAWELKLLPRELFTWLFFSLFFPVSMVWD